MLPAPSSASGSAPAARPPPPPAVPTPAALDATEPEPPTPVRFRPEVAQMTPGGGSPADVSAKTTIYTAVYSNVSVELSSLPDREPPSLASSHPSLCLVCGPRADLHAGVCLFRSPCSSVWSVGSRSCDGDQTRECTELAPSLLPQPVRARPRETASLSGCTSKLCSSRMIIVNATDTLDSALLRYADG